MKHLLIPVALLLALHSGLAISQSTEIVGVPIKIGDPIETVKAALQTSIEPEEMTSAVRTNTKALRLKTKGIWVFFDRTNRAYNIRLDAPFPGNVGGIKIGDSLALLEKTLGKPAKVMKIGISIPGRYEPYLYYIDDLTTVRFDFDRDGLIETIFVMK